MHLHGFLQKRKYFPGKLFSILQGFLCAKLLICCWAFMAKYNVLFGKFKTWILTLPQGSNQVQFYHNKLYMLCGINFGVRLLYCGHYDIAKKNLSIDSLIIVRLCRNIIRHVFVFSFSKLQANKTKIFLHEHCSTHKLENTSWRIFSINATRCFDEKIIYTSF
jgi:hypothetical protein